MRSKRNPVVRAAGGGAILMLAALTGCGYAKKDQVDAQFEALRGEMQTSHQAMDQRTNDVSGRVDQLETRVNGLENRTAALERDLQALRTDFNTTIERMEGMLSFSTPVKFEFDASDIRQTDRPMLDKFAAVVKQYYPNAVVTVEGFTDAVGSEAYNMRLGMQRAEAVRDYLVSTAGLEATNVRAVSYGGRYGEPSRVAGNRLQRCRAAAQHDGRLGQLRTSVPTGQLL